MKRCRFLLLALIGLALVSCEKKKADSNANAALEQDGQEWIDLSDIEETINPEDLYSSVDGVMLYDEGSLWLESTEGEMLFAGKTLPAGTKLSIITNADGTYILKKAIRNSNNEKVEREFTKLDVEGSAYWVQTNIIAMDAVPAVITYESFLYKSPSKLAPYTPTVLLSFGDVIAVSTDEIIAEDQTIFHKAYLKRGDKVYENVYVEDYVYTTSEQSFYMMDLIKAMDSASNETAMNELIQIGSALAESPMVNSQITIKFVDKLQEVLTKEKVVPMKDRYVFDDYYVDAVPGDGENFNVRDNPSMKAEVLKTISSGQPYEIILMTVETEVVNGNEGHWYYIRGLKQDSSFDVAGWVFGDRFNIYARNIDTDEVTV